MDEDVTLLLLLEENRAVAFTGVLLTHVTAVLLFAEPAQLERVVMGARIAMTAMLSTDLS